MTMQLHAVIQGPLTSPPRPGRSWPAGITTDCVPFVLETASTISERGGTALVSTWLGEDAAKRDPIASHPAVAGLIESPDPGKPPDTNGPVGGNRLRQVLSTWWGLEELRRRGAAGLVAKIRTDQTVPVELVHGFADEFLAGCDQSARDTIVFIVAAHATSLYEVDDFIFVGTLPAMTRFFEAQVRLAPFHSGTISVHGDLVRKHLAWTVGPALGWPAWRSFPVLPFKMPTIARPRVHSGIIGPWVQTLCDYLIPLPREVWQRMTWRGSPPFAEWGESAGLTTDNRWFFEDRELLTRRGEDVFLEKWPGVFTARGSGWWQRPLDYAIEIPHEIQRGRASAATKLLRRTRRLINKFRFRN